MDFFKLLDSDEEPILLVVGILPLDVNASLVSPVVVVDVDVVLVVVEKPYFIKLN
jgi:hypothetical protein